MVYRIFVEKKKELANEAKALLNDANTLLGISALKDVRVINRYDAENITEETLPAVKKLVTQELNRFTKELNYALKGKGAR